MEDIIKGTVIMSAGADILNGISGSFFARSCCIVFHIDF